VFFIKIKTFFFIYVENNAKCDDIDNNAKCDNIDNNQSINIRLFITKMTYRIQCRWPNQ